MNERTLSSSEARDAFSDALNRAAYCGERTIVVRRGKRIAAICPIDQGEPKERPATRKDHR